MDIEALETYARDLDVSNCSKPELRRLVAAAASIAERTGGSGRPGFFASYGGSRSQSCTCRRRIASDAS